MIRIGKVVVTDDAGNEHTYEGEGFLMTTSAQEKTAGVAKITGTQVTANLHVPKEN